MRLVMLTFILRCSHYMRLDYRVVCRTSVRQRTFSTCSQSTVSTEHGDSGNKTSLLWLSANRLRVRDNLALLKAAEFGPDGLTICAVWPYGRIPTSQMKRDEVTPVEAFGFAAARSLNDSLATMGQKLWLIPSEKNGDVANTYVSTIAEVVQHLQPDTVIVDTCLLDQHLGHASKLRDELAHFDSQGSGTNVVAVVDEGVLINFSDLPKVLGRSRNGGRALRWSTFLGNTLSRKEKLDEKKTWTISKLPPPLIGIDKVMKSSVIPSIKCFPRWARELLSGWGEASEDEAIRRANMNTKTNVNEFGTNELSERGSKDTKLSPYLRWGIISPQRASKAGVRKRDLLWRDWSNVCYGLVGPLRRGEPVLEYLDKCNKISSTDVDAKEEELFNMWIVGNTGSPLVDAGMRQLWREGWMPRKIRLLAATCLVEGMGVDWRFGRDWFRETLIDHDPAINELMWQNAGFVGVDPFYNGISWEAAPTDSQDIEYVRRWKNEQLDWPSHLKEYDKRQPFLNIIAMAKSRRDALRVNRVYKAARMVSNSGIRVAWPGLIYQNSVVVAGEVIGVGLKPLDELTL